MVDTYYTLENVKTLLGESGDTNNDKIDQYGAMADNKINIAHQNIFELTIPLDPIPQEVHDLADVITLGYFYKFESGSVDILEQALVDLIDYIDTKFRRVRFKTATAPGAIS